MFGQLEEEKQVQYLVLHGGVTSTEGKKLSNALLVISSEGTVVDSVSCSKSGKFKNTKLELGKTYAITYCAKGYLPKVLTFDLKKNYYSEDFADDTEMDLSLSLDQKKEGADYSNLEDGFVIARFFIDSRNVMVTVDMPYTNKRSKYYKQILQEIETNEEKK
jgi:hypothetical protein